MVKKIGKWLICILLGAISLKAVATTLELSIENKQGIALTSVGLGVPFSILVTVKDVNKMRSRPSIEGLHHFKVIGQRSDMNMNMQGANASQELRFLYTVVADTAGDYTIGPARIENLESKTADVSIINARLTRKEEYPAPIYQCILEKNHAVVGEKIAYCLRFSYQDPDSTLTHVESPQIQGLRVGGLDEGHASSKVINNELFQIIEFKGFLYPERSGLITLSRLRADYTEKARNQSWGFLGFGGFAEKKAVYSQPVSLTIDELPNVAGLQAVGIFNHFTAQLTSTRVPQSEAAILTLLLEGNADFEKITAPKLDLPKDLRSYESKSSVEVKGKLSSKKWEYVIQGLKEGTYAINAQHFTYYDTHARAVKTLKTKPLSLTILPSAHAPVTREPEKEDKTSQTLSPVQQSKPSRPYELPSILFLVLFLLPPFFALAGWLLPNLKTGRKILVQRWRSLSALSRASYRIKKACKAQDISQLSRIMITACQEYYSADSTCDATFLEQQGWSKDTLTHWEAFLRELLAFSNFAPAKEIGQNERAKLCAQAQQWLARIKKGKMT